MRKREVQINAYDGRALVMNLKLVNLNWGVTFVCTKNGHNVWEMSNSERIFSISWRISVSWILPCQRCKSDSNWPNSSVVERGKNRGKGAQKKIRTKLNGQRDEMAVKRRPKWMLVLDHRVKKWSVSIWEGGMRDNRRWEAGKANTLCLFCCLPHIWII